MTHRVYSAREERARVCFQANVVKVGTAGGKKRRKTSTGAQQREAGDRIEGGDRDNSTSVRHTQAEWRWIGNGESASGLAIVRRARSPLAYFPRKYAGAGVLHRAWWARKEDNEGRKPLQWLCMRFLIRLRDRLNDPSTSYLRFRVTLCRSSLSLSFFSPSFFSFSLLRVDLFAAGSSTRSICSPPYVYYRSSRFPRQLYGHFVSGETLKAHLYIVGARIDSVFFFQFNFLLIFK